MDMWWWVPIGLAAWFLASVAIGLCIGPVLRRFSQVRESLDQQFREISDGDGSPRDEQQASPGRLSAAAGDSDPVPAARSGCGAAILRQRRPLHVEADRGRVRRALGQRCGHVPSALRIPG